MSEKLTTLIDEIVHEKTFSLEAVNAVTNLRDTAEALESQVRILTKKNKTNEENAKIHEIRVSKLRNEVEDWKKREADLIVREMKILNLELGTAVSNAKAETYKECVSLIFRNETVRKEMFGSIPVSIDGGYPTVQSTNETITETKE